MRKNMQRMGLWLWLTVPIAVLLAVAAGSGVFVEFLYHRDSPSFALQAVAQDRFSLWVVLPLLIVSAWLTNRGSGRGRLICLGTLVYLVYTYTIAAFHVRFNSMFLVYVALLGCSLYALIGGIVSTDLAGIKANFAGDGSARAISIYLGISAALFYFLWLSEVVPASLAGEIPPSVIENDTATNAVHVLDMAWILPAMLFIAISLWRKRALAYTLAGAMLTYMVLLVAAVLSMIGVMAWSGASVTGPGAFIFGLLFLVSLGMLIWYLSGWRAPSRAHSSLVKARMLLDGEEYPE